MTLPLPMSRNYLRKFQLRVYGHKYTGYYHDRSSTVYTYTDGVWLAIPATTFNNGRDAIRAYWEGRRAHEYA